MYRVKQFFWGLKALYTKIDEDLIKRFLTKDEIEIFKKLKISDQHHCVRVCRDSLEANKKFELNVDEYKLGKAALLHDIGKAKFHLNLFEKSIIVILDRITRGKISKFKNIKQIDVYFNHPKIGYEILEGKGYPKELLEVVRYHHNKEKLEHNDYLNIIAFCDDKN